MASRCLCRVHSECLTGDALGSARCDCGQQYDAAMKMIAKEGQGRASLHASGGTWHWSDQ